MKYAIWFATALFAFGALPVFATSTLSDDQIRAEIVKASVDDYLATGHRCACPYNLARNRSQCGGRSAYSRPGGAAPMCYPSDVSQRMVDDWRQAH